MLPSGRQGKDGGGPRTPCRRFRRCGPAGDWPAEAWAGGAGPCMPAAANDDGDEDRRGAVVIGGGLLPAAARWVSRNYYYYYYYYYY